MPVSNPTFCEIRDEGISQGVSRIFDFTGGGVSVSIAGGVATVNVPSPAGGTSWTAFTQDLGAARRSGTFDITGLSGLTAEKVVDIRQTAAKITSKGDARDEPEMDQIEVTGYVVDATTIRAYWCAPSVVVGTYAFAYIVGA